MKSIISIALTIAVLATLALCSPVGKCPEKQSRHHLVTLLPDDRDCAKLWICNHGTPQPIKCPAGLVFNAALGVCDWPNSEEDRCDVEPTTTEPTTEEPATADPISALPTTGEPATAEPISADPSSNAPTTVEPITTLTLQ